MREEAGEGGVHRQGRRRAEAKVKTDVLDAFSLDRSTRVAFMFFPCIFLVGVFELVFLRFHEQVSVSCFKAFYSFYIMLMLKP